LAFSDAFGIEGERSEQIALACPLLNRPAYGSAELARRTFEFVAPNPKLGPKRYPHPQKGSGLLCYAPYFGVVTERASGRLPDLRLLQGLKARCVALLGTQKTFGSVGSSPSKALASVASWVAVGRLAVGRLAVGRPTGRLGPLGC